MTKDDINAIGLAALKDFEKDRNAKAYMIRQTSGTTLGKPLLICRARGVDKKDLDGRTYKEIKAPALFFGSFNARLSHLSNFFTHNADPAGRALVLSPQDINADLGRILSEFQPDAFLGFPSVMVRALVAVDQKNADALTGVHSVHFIGEALTGIHRDVLRHKIPDAQIYGHYATAETGFLSAFPCAYTDANQYHPHRKARFRLVSADQDGIGEIAVSSPLSRTVSLTDYLVGDVGRMIPGPCRCGNETTFELMGRKNFDFIKLSGIVLRQELFERAVASFDGLIADYRGEAREVWQDNKIYGALTLNVLLNPDSHAKIDADGGAAAYIAREFPKRLYLTQTATFDSLIQRGIFLPFAVAVVKEFPYQHKSVKIRKIET